MSRPSRRVRQRLVRRLTAQSSAAKAEAQARKERIALSRLKACLPSKRHSLTFAKLEKVSPKEALERLTALGIKGVPMHLALAKARQLGILGGKLGAEAGNLYLYRGKRSGGSMLANSLGKLTNSNGMLSPDNLELNSYTAAGMYDGLIRIRDANGKRPSGLPAIGLAVCLAAAWDGTDKLPWLTETGFQVAHWLGFTTRLTGELIPTYVDGPTYEHPNRVGRVVYVQRSIRAQNAGSGNKVKPKPKPPLGQRINERHGEGLTAQLIPVNKPVIWVRRNGTYVPVPVSSGEPPPKGETVPKGFKLLANTSAGKVYIKRPK